MDVKNELGVIVRFAQVAESTDCPWRIQSIDGFFPDAIIEQKHIGDTQRVEFEYLASSFVSHGHDLEKCDVIICWENDWADCPITVWALSGDCSFALRPRSEWVIQQAKKDIELARLRKRVSKLELLLETGQSTIGPESLVLTVNEQRLMVLLLKNEQGLCDREEITQAVWNLPYDWGDDSRIEQLISRLRSKLSDLRYPGTIKTIRGRGYTLRCQE